jgi:hypothetical protein
MIFMMFSLEFSCRQLCVNAPFSPKHYPSGDTPESNCRLNTVRRWHSRYSPRGDYKIEVEHRRGVFRVKILAAVAHLRATNRRARV